MQPDSNEDATHGDRSAEASPQPTLKRGRWVPVAAGVVLLISALFGPWANPFSMGASNSVALPGASNTKPLAPGNEAPSFTLQDLNGRAVSLDEYKGQRVVINFWATWCPPCRSEMPDIQQIQQEHGSSGVTILAVNLQEAREPISAFIAKYGLTFSILMDTTGEVSQAYRVQSLPSTVFVDREGRIASVNVGAMNKAAILKRLEGMLE